MSGLKSRWFTKEPVNFVAMSNDIFFVKFEVNFWSCSMALRSISVRHGPIRQRAESC